MRFGFSAVVFGLALLSAAHAQDSTPSGVPSWQDEIARGFVPYRQLTVEDLPLNDQTDAQTAFTIKGFIHPRWRFPLTTQEGLTEVQIDQWIVYSGLDKNVSWRKSRFEMKEALPYAQALLDINEICARQIAALKPTDLPRGIGASYQEIQADLDRRIAEFLADKYKQIQRENDAFAKATNNGKDAKKVREKAAEIRKRLEATPATTVPFTASTSGGSPSPIAK